MKKIEVILLILFSVIVISCGQPPVYKTSSTVCLENKSIQIGDNFTLPPGWKTSSTVCLENKSIQIGDNFILPPGWKTSSTEDDSTF